MECLAATPADQLSRVKAIAFTDSVHSVDRATSSDVRALLREKAVSWVSSRAELDKVLEDNAGGSSSGCIIKSAGTEDHASTNFAAEDSILALFDASVASVVGGVV